MSLFDRWFGRETAEVTVSHSLNEASSVWGGKNSNEMRVVGMAGSCLVASLVPEIGM